MSRSPVVLCCRTALFSNRAGAPSAMFVLVWRMWDSAAAGPRGGGVWKKPGGRPGQQEEQKDEEEDAEGHERRNLFVDFS
ncbi:hypothetical protein AXG93_3751s1070 [Marchantia polymorpha subsp. ruderalis]|uniref:Uncharacterized protein n=1 Tax=Marchantia polymorpha subsp. ruderalis TaxID=1480154 RepID=A0A176VZL4_MARPO|nr:hypothetical protein AXG93_3751s1070 [Marchantia polymorpha subsp. ruderalis]